MAPWIRTALAAALVVATAIGCATAARTRRDYVQSITTLGCAKYLECGRIGPGRDFRSLEECSDAVLWKLYDQWPEAQCDGRINSARFDACAERAEALSCDADFMNVVANLGECAQARVCIDPRMDKTIYPRQFAQQDED